MTQCRVPPRFFPKRRNDIEASMQIKIDDLLSINKTLETTIKELRQCLQGKRSYTVEPGGYVQIGPLLKKPRGKKPTHSPSGSSDTASS